MVRKFKKDDSGAVTVDWVVMAASVVGIGVASMGVVSEGVNDVSADTSALLESSIISTSFSDGLANIADWLSGYSPVSALHGPSWGSDPNWVEDTYSNWSALSDADLQANYNADYASANGGGDAVRADCIAVQERILNERGIGIPDGNSTAAEVALLY